MSRPAVTDSETNLATREKKERPADAASGGAYRRERKMPTREASQIARDRALLEWPRPRWLINT